MAPITPPGGSMTLELEHDIQLLEQLDELGVDEALLGEHHSGGWEIYTSPEQMIAHAAARTKHIKLGTGVTSLSYRNPLIVADGMAQLDHLTRGRLVFGVGPGALPGDAHMMGVDYKFVRRRMEESMDAIMHLFTSDEPLTVETDWFKLTEARLHYKSLQRPHPEMAVAAVGSPGGPRVAGKFGLPLLSLGGNNEDNVKVMASHWKILEERADEFGVPVASRFDWRIVGPMHIAETREQAEREVEHGLDKFMSYFFRLPVSFLSIRDGEGNIIKNASSVELIRDSGFGVIGTVEDAIAHIHRLQRTVGGFGRFMLQHHSWADREATSKSFELFAKYVMPHFQDGVRRRQEWWDHDRGLLDQVVGDVREGMQEAQDRHNQEYGATDTNVADILTPGPATG
jgi:limonene 1,2-monooxygenase